MPRNSNSSNQPQPFQNESFDELIRYVVRDELSDLLSQFIEQIESRGENDFEEGRQGEEDFRAEIERESEEEGVSPSQTRAYHRMKSRQTRDSNRGSRGTQGSRGSSNNTGNRGQVTDPEHDNRLKQNRG